MAPHDIEGPDDTDEQPDVEGPDDTDKKPDAESDQTKEERL